MKVNPLKGIERLSEIMPKQKHDCTIAIDHRYYPKSALKEKRRVRISIVRNNTIAVELNPDDAIEFFRQGIEYAERLKALNS